MDLASPTKARNVTAQAKELAEIGQKVATEPSSRSRPARRNITRPPPDRSGKPLLTGPGRLARAFRFDRLRGPVL